MESKNKHQPAQCPRCSRSFSCTMSIDCWCMEVELPRKVKDHLAENYEGCLCPECIDELKYFLLTKKNTYE